MMWAQAGSPLTAAVVAVHKGRCCSAAGDIRSYSRRPAAALSATKRCSSRRMKTSAFAGEEKSAAAPTAEPKAAQQQQQGGGRKRAVIAGAGPAGSLAALYLAKQGWHVTVCDRRGSATEAFTSADILAYNIGLNDRGILAIRDAGLDLPQGIGVAVSRSVFHFKDGAGVDAVAVAPPAFEFTLVSRERLSFALHAAAVARHPRSVSHRWGAAGDVRGLDTDARAVSFADDSSITFDLLVAADGVRSRVRTLLAEQGRVRVTQQPEDEFKVKSFLGEPPAAPSVPVLVEQAEGWTEEVEDAAAAWRTALHWWYSDDSSGRPILLGQPHWDGRMLYSLCLPTQEGWDALGTAEALQASLSRWYPDLPLLPPGAAARVATTPLPPGPRLFTTVCDALDVAGAPIVLIGDGCNAALESAAVLAQVLRAHDGDPATALPAFTRLRKPDTDAIGRLSVRGGATPIGGGRNSPVRAALLEAARTLLPMCFSASAFVQAARPGVRYSDVERAVQRESTTLAAAVAAPASMFVFGLLTAAAGSPLAASAGGAALLGVPGPLFYAQVGLGAVGVLSALWLAFAATAQMRSLLGGEGAQQAASGGGTPRMSFSERIEAQAAQAAAGKGAAVAGGDLLSGGGDHDGGGTGEDSDGNAGSGSSSSGAAKKDL